MRQEEIQFFWPLTEQIPLDLDYAPCEPPKVLVKYDTGVTFATSDTYSTTSAWGTLGAIRLKATELVIETPQMPWYRKAAFKLLGFKWK